jgi:hypothetical protein
MSRRFCDPWALALLIAAAPLVSSAADLGPALAKIRAVGPKGEGHAQALSAAKAVSAASAADLPQILAAMDGANNIAANWLRIAAESASQRGGKLPVAELEKFLADTKHSPRGRRLAYELIAGVDPTAEARLIPTLLDDPSTELRRDAVTQFLAGIKADGDKAARLAAYRKAFGHARDLDQIKDTTAKLKELGETPDVAGHMGYLLTWQIIGPFDNVADKGWNTAYPPETKVDLAAEYDGQKGKIKWLAHTTADEYGMVDLTKALDKHKGAVAYAYAELTADRAQPCELRLGSANANKIWLNGKLLTENHVYHANQTVDQYIAKGQLTKGKNTILVKICQNEQTEEWAQTWQFHLRVCDAIGTAILSQDRLADANKRGGEGERGRGGD